MKAFLIAALAALVVGGTASAAGPPGTNLAFKVKAPKAGHVKIYGFTVTAHLPAGMSITGFAPFVTATNGKALPKGTLAAAAVVTTASGVWHVYVAVDMKKASGAGAASLSGNVQLSGPLANVPSDIHPGGGGNPCAEFDKVLHQLGNNGDALNQGAVLLWVMIGPTDAGRKIDLDDDCK
jgi:hypothetical protein